MATFGYGEKEEEMYLKALELAEQGNATLLFHFEKNKTVLYKILTSHKLKINMNDVTVEKLEEFKNHVEENGEVSLYCIDEVNLSFEEIKAVIERNKKQREITDVVFDRLDKEKKSSVKGLCTRLGIKLHYFGDIWD
ncbi:hypothetical protein [Paenibacillus oryzisoli]|uniref:Uncharacterized protein n=1 Tax=Paenibacillus oryzisoli TaxID=1850517 RepID=A0A197ZX53_9BACL|nr:hypothetical protein [Paenibacillus oryzisoli]OAS13744.1 hypothetical protein A8708_25220 [Paenibacillus oryzisoli]